MTDSLSNELVRRLRERAQDPVRRSGDAALAAGSVGLGDAFEGLRADVGAGTEDHRRAVDEYLGGINSPFAGIMRNTVTGDGSQARGLLGALGVLMGGKQLFAMAGDLGVVSIGAPADPAPAPPPASDPQVAAAEATLGFGLPPALRQIYTEVADGGFGPGGGLYGLSDLVAKYREMTDEPVGPQGQQWPAELLPIHGDDWDLVCLDRRTGRLVFWDLEELDDDDELPPDQPTWAASFVPEADGLETWLARWVASG
jgi:hypothetical protein